VETAQDFQDAQKLKNTHRENLQGDRWEVCAAHDTDAFDVQMAASI
jgi:uncharacterized protein (DUF2237 family)